MWVYFVLTSCVWGIPSFPFFPPPFPQRACGFLGPLPRQGKGERRSNWCSTTGSPKSPIPSHCARWSQGWEDSCDGKRMAKHRDEKRCTQRISWGLAVLWPGGKARRPSSRAGSICCWCGGTWATRLSTSYGSPEPPPSGIFSSTSFQLKTGVLSHPWLQYLHSLAPHVV